MYALVDCNNFYCSCERIFQPSLQHRAIVVLSNNDGCVISRSDEAKQMGIVMGTPAHIIQTQLKQQGVVVFSSNYTLYGDMSDRVMQTLARFVPAIEVYSIDEAFLDMHDMLYTDLGLLGLNIRRTLLRDTGIPVTIGIAPTKTLAKMANRYAKKHFKATGVFWAASETLVDDMLAQTPVSDVWGIGHQHALLLNRNGIVTAADFARAPEAWVRDQLSVVGLRTQYELRGEPAIGWETDQADKRNICTSRSFGSTLTAKAEIAEAVSNYAAVCAQKLRQQQCSARLIQVMLQTNAHTGYEQQYMRTINLKLETASNHTGELIRYALKGFGLIFKDGYRYMKAGVLVSELLPDSAIQSGLFDHVDRKKADRVMTAIDRLNATFGREKIRMAAQGFERKYQMRADHKSPRYTTNFEELLKVRI